MPIELTQATLRALRKLGFATCDDHARCKRVVVEIIAHADNTEHCWLGIHCPGGIIALPIPAEKVLIAAGVKASEAA